MSGLDGLLAGTDAVLFDFDGPVCSLFAGYPAAVIATEIRAFLTAKRVCLPPALRDGPDPLRLFRWAAARHPDLSGEVEEILSAAELHAAETAAPTSHAREAIIASVQSGRTVAVVSNNSHPAIARYLDEHGLTAHVSTISGRARGHPELMKPHPDAIIRAAADLEVSRGACVLVGDAVTDIHAAQRAGTHSIGYAKSTARVRDLTEARAEVIIENMALLASALQHATRGQGKG